MLEEIIRCDLERELENREKAEMAVRNEAESMSAQNQTTQEQKELLALADHSEQIEALMHDVKEKMSAIRTPAPDNAYPTVLEGPKWKVLIKRCMRKLTWWFINRIVVIQHWRNEMISASVESLAESVRLLEAMEVANRNMTFRMNEELREKNQRIQWLETELNMHGKHMEALQESVIASDAQDERLRQLETAERTRRDRDRLEEEKRKADDIRKDERLLQLEIAERTRRDRDRLEEEKRKADDISNYIDYVAFENRFRGSQDEIKRRIERYLQYFIPGQKILDLGCGRGEWLEMLKGFGVDASGVDINPRCVEICLVKQLHAVQEDMFAYLEDLEDASLDGITSLQVIEHITPAQLARLVRLCHRKLRTGGVLILETPNPAVMYTLAYTFYVDPTHIRPVHPNWLKYLLEHSGFCDVVLDYPDYSVIWEAAQAHSLVSENQADANRRVDFLNNMLFGPTDYAGIARKM